MTNLDELIKHYSYIVKYSLEDELYVAKCLELGIMAHADRQEEAIKEIKEATRVHLLMLDEDGESIPQPLSDLQVYELTN